MASISAIAPASAAVIAKLKANAAVIARVPAARIVDDAPARFPMPFILVQVPIEAPHDTMGGSSDLPKWGHITTVNVSVVTQERGEAEVGQIKSLILTALNGIDLVVDGFSSVSIDARASVTQTDTVNGVTTRQLTVPFDVMVHQ